MRRSTIHPSLFAVMLDSAPNAARKGQAQYFTPDKWAKLLAHPLPSPRQTIVDLTAGQGHLLRGTANASTKHRLACDVDPAAGRASGEHITADLTLLASILHDVAFEADLFVLNPPWDLHWHRDRLAFLEQSDLPSVSAAFAAHDGRTSAGTIDSSVATLCLALDLCSTCGEGYLIMNHSTARRLILDPGAPHGDLASHVWAVLDLPADTAAPVPSSVLYFARDHRSGVEVRAGRTELLDALDDPTNFVHQITAKRWLRKGAEVNSWSLYTPDSAKVWDGCREEYQRIHGHGAATAPTYNVWIDRTGHIGTHVSLYDERTGRVPVQEAAALHSLNGQRPLQLVVQRARREVLMRACGLEGDTAIPTPWRIDPALQDAVREALNQYRSARAPLYPLPPIQRLGYLDEEDWITCKAAVLPGFATGKRYAITTQTLAVRHRTTRINLAGEPEKLELTGQELAIFITDCDGRRRCFLESRLMTNDVLIENPEGTRPTNRKKEPLAKENLPADSFAPATQVADFSLQQLVEAFEIPEVPDVASVDPLGYEANLQFLTRLETLSSAALA